MAERMHEDDLIFLGAAMLLSQRTLAKGTENTVEVKTAISTAQELYAAVVSATSQGRPTPKVNLPVNQYLKNEAKKVGE